MTTEFFIKAVPTEESTQGYMKVKEYGQNINMHFMMAEDFRGKLKAVTWNLPNNVKHRISAEDDPEQWKLFRQVGERPEIVVDSSWFDTMKLPKTAQLRIRFDFDTFRYNSSWYAFLYLKQAYGDQKPPYKIPKEGETDQPDTPYISVDSDDPDMIVFH